MRGFQKALWLHARRPGRVLKKPKAAFIRYTTGAGVGWGKKIFVVVLKIFGRETGGGGGGGW